jgi:hypothetical protein
MLINVEDALQQQLSHTVSTASCLPRDGTSEVPKDVKT